MTTEKADHILAVVKAGIAGIPMIGGPIASLIGDYIPTATQRSMNKTLDFLASEITRLEGRIDMEAINRDEFSEVFKNCLLTVVRTHQEAKLRAVARLIANALLQDGETGKLSFSELDFFSRCVDGLSIGAVEVLIHVAEIARSRDPKKFGERNIQLSFDELHNRVAEKADFLMAQCEELNSYHLVHLTGAPTVRTPEYANYPLELPPLGARFVTHVLDVSGDERTQVMTVVSI
ncbi:MAG: hypothetical protein GXP29_15180 [Planctomycetes bacterium]|nr:hypothetical protein [Planctomycetota bacterium]